MRFITLILLTLVAGAVTAEEGSDSKQTQNIKKEKSPYDKNIVELKSDLESESAEYNKFIRHTDLVERYADRRNPEKLTPDNSVEAKAFAESLLKLVETYKTDWNYGNAVHFSHLVLGRVKLFQGDIDGAKSELLLAAKMKGSPQLDTFGPSMALAKELLIKGEKNTVLEYFDECRKFWIPEYSNIYIDSWKKEVIQGQIPDFQKYISNPKN